MSATAWLLRLLAVASLLWAVAAVALYVAVVHLALLERLVALALRKGLRGLAAQDAAARQPAYRVARTAEGVHIQNLALASHVLQRLGFLAVEVETASVESLEASLPSWTRPLRLRLRGLAVTLRQRNMPKHVRAADLAEEERRSGDELKFVKLDAIDRLLWGTQDRSRAGAGEGSLGSRLRVLALHRALALAVRFLDVDAASLRFTYLQEGEPGPLPNPHSRMAGRDGAEVSVRRLLLTPQAERTAPTVNLAASDASAAEVEVAVAAPRGLLAVLRLPAAVWRHATLDVPTAAQAALSGVDITLLAFRRGPAPPAVAPAAPPAGSGAGFSAGARGSSPARAKRRRGNDAPMTSPLAPAPAAGPPPAAAARPPGGGAETHVLLRQWGVEARLAIEPPRREGRPRSRPPTGPARQRRPDPPPQPHRREPLPSPFEQAASQQQRQSPQQERRPNGVGNGRAHHAPEEPSKQSEPKPAFAGRLPSGVTVDTWQAGDAASPPPAEDGGLEASPPPSGVCTLAIDVRLRALVPRLTPAALAVALRMADRANEYAQYADYWQTRPEAPVRASPSAWWQHAISAAKRECRLVSRREVPGSAIAARRTNRLQYQQLYARTHSRLRSFTEPQRRWWQRRRTPKAGSEDAAVLRAMEQQLSMEEIAHFRAGVAGVHSSAMLSSADHFSVAIDAVDAVVGNLGPLPAPIAAMLFGESDAAQPRQLLAVAITAACPKIGALLAVDWTGEQQPPQQQPPERQIGCLEALVSRISCSVSAAGDTELTVGSIAIAGKHLEEGPVQGHVLQSPSLAANRMLQVADLHGVASSARGFAAELSQGAASFLSLRVLSDAGRWMRHEPVLGSAAAPQQQPPPPEAAVIRPPGMHVIAELAAIEVEYTEPLVLAGLRFAAQLAALQEGGAAAAPPGAAVPPEPKLDPGQPVTLKERVLHAFAQQNMPVYKPLMLPPTLVKLSCPGLAARLHYRHHTTVGCQEAFTETSCRHELIAAVTRVRAELDGEDFSQFMRGGTIHRYMLHAYLDLFCYQPPASRPRADAEASAQSRATAFGNRTITGQRRATEAPGAAAGPFDGPDGGDGQEMAAMAKVWAHPEDLRMYPTQAMSLAQQQRGSFSGAPSLRAGRRGRVPTFPMIPLLKVAGWQLEAAHKVHLLPAAPGSLSLSVASAMHGIMAWVSPWQVSHLLSILDGVRRHLPPSSSGGGGSSLAAEPAGPAPVQKAGLSAMRTQLRIQASLEIPLISAICSVSRTAAELEAALARPQRPGVRGQWRHRVPESDPAFVWTHCLAPTYGVNVVGSRAALSFKGTGHLRGGLAVDGLLVRDLQLPPTSRHAFFLRPLPARADALSRHATRFRTRILRVVQTSAARRRWSWAVRRVALRRRSTLATAAMEARMDVRAAALPFASFVGLRTAGPQLVACCYLPPAAKYPGHPDFQPAPPARLDVQLGQLLLYLRVSSNNRMLPFCSQIIDLVGGVSQPPPQQQLPGAGGAEVQRQGPATRQQSQRQEMQGARFAGLSVAVGVVGVHLGVVVQGRELLALQLQDAALGLNVAPDPPPPDGNALAVRLRILDLSIRDLQALPEHAVVLQPNKAAEHCSLAVDFSSPLQPGRAALLVIEFANPRFLALFRFIYDVLHGVDILAAAFASNSSKLPKPAEPAAEAGEARQGGSGASSGSSSSSSSGAGGPEILIHLTNAGVVLPASSRSLQVLAADVDYVMLGMPGASLSDAALTAAGLPSVRGMLAGSMAACRLFKADAPAQPPMATPAGAARARPLSPARSAPAPDAARPPKPEGNRQRWARKLADASPRKAEPPAHAQRPQPLPQRQQAGVLFLSPQGEAGPPPAPRKGVLKIDVGGGQGRAAAPAAALAHEPDARSATHTAEAGESLLSSPPPRQPSAAPEHVDLQRGLEAPLPGEPPSEAGEAGELPQASLAVFAEGIVVSRAALRPMGPACAAHSFCPDSVHHFAPPKCDSVTVDRAPFLQPSSYCVILFEHACAPAPGGAYQHAHLAAAPVVVIMNAPNYAALLGFAQGNLTEISSYEGAAGGGGGGAGAGRTPQRTAFNPAFQFAPPRGDLPSFRLTAGLPLITTVFEADPSHWQSGSIRSRLGDPAALPRLPFLRLQVHGAGLDLGTLARSGATYIQVSAGSAACDDLRLAYSSIMTEYEVYSEDSLGELPQARGRAGGGLRADATAEEVAARVASELQSEDESPPPPPLQSRASINRRERSGEFLRQRSVQMAARGPRRAASDSAAAGLPDSDWGSAQPPPPPPLQPPAAVPFPIVDMALVGSLEAHFPAGSPVVHLLRAPAPLPAAEAEHLGSRGAPRAGGEALRATIALLKDGTTAVELQLSAALLQWPFLSDLTLAAAAASIFAPPPEAPAGAEAAPASAFADSLAPWLYFNAVLEDCQLFVPVADPDTLEDSVNHYFGGGAAAMNLHERLADLLLMQLAFSMEDPEAALRPEERGVAVTWAALRVSFAQGGDGGSDVRADLRRFAAFVRDPAAVVTCVLLPHSCSLHLEVQAPQAQERAATRRRLYAVLLIQRAWRRFRRQRAGGLASRASQGAGSTRGGPSSSAARPLGASPSRGSLRAARASSLSLHQRMGCLLDQLVEEVASPRTHAVLREYAQQTRAGGASSVQKEAARTHVGVRMGPLTVRAAFSHVPFLQSMLWMANTMVLPPSPGAAADAARGPAERDAAADFRPSAVHADGTVQGLALVLCNDRPQTFGAPDVLRLSVDQLSAKYVRDQRFPDRPPDQVAQLDAQVGAQFLNNSSSRWEAICEAWQVQAELVDSVSPIYRSDFQRHIWLTSKQHLSVHFNPSSMLSVGDLLAFVSEVSAPLQPRRGPGAADGGAGGRAAALEAAPGMREQMAQQGGITARVPQKYLIQNQSGLRVYYWVDKDGEGRPQRTHSLASGVSETLRVEPRRRVLQHVSPGRASVGKVQNVISLHFEGNWLPLKEVAVSVVGKYRYQMYSPAEHDRAPVVVDVILVGRTKIITLHSGLWLENRTDRRLSFRLHVPVSPLVAPSAGRSSGGDPRPHRGADDHTIGPLQPGSGTYLPVTAVLGGSLFLRPSGYAEAERDVIRLSPSIADVEAQQGHIVCQPLPGSSARQPLHCSLIVHPAQVNSEFQAFKHIEMLAPGELAKATKPLEATLAVHPTLVLTNALPYAMEVTVWQVPAFKKLRREKAAAGQAGLLQSLRFDYQQMRTAFTGTVPVSGEASPYPVSGSKEGDLVVSTTRPTRASPSLLSLTETEGTKGSGSDSDDLLQLRLQGAPLPPRPADAPQTPGRRMTVSLLPGASQNVYANMEGNVLVHVAVPPLGMVARHWAVVSWSSDQRARESLFDAKYIYRLPKEITLRHLESRGRSWGRRRSRQASVQRWQAVARGLKEGASRRLATPQAGAPLAAPAASGEAGGASAGGAGPSGREGEEQARWFNALYQGSPGSRGSGEAGAPRDSGPPVEYESGSGGAAAAAAAVTEVGLAEVPTGDGAGPSSPSAEGEIQAEDSGSESGLEWEDAADLLRDAFLTWREEAVRNSIARGQHRGLPAGPGVNAPEELLLHVQNSLAEGREAPICRLSFYSPCWVDNRTDMGLVLQDHASAGPNPLLLGYTTPLDFRPVVSPAVGLVEPTTPRGSHRSFWDISDPSEIDVRPTLLNKQERTRFCLADSVRRRYSSAIHIDTVGLKGSMRVKGPVPKEGVLARFKAAASPPSRAADASGRGPASEQDADLTGIQAACEASEGPGWVEEVQVRIEPLLKVDIRELSTQDSRTDGSAAVLIRPRSPASEQRLVSVELTPVSRRASARQDGAALSEEQCGDSLLLGPHEGAPGAVARAIALPDDEEEPQLEPDPAAYTVGRREFEFIAEVSSAPPSSVFRLTKVLTIKPRLVVDNQTGMAVEVKQRGTPDLDADPCYGGERRCSCRLEANQRKAFHWDNCELERMLVVRPLGDAATGAESEWQWSGGFAVATREEYFGLRIRHKSIQSRAMNIPVNCTVGPSGFVLVTFKSRHSVPPYRIENRTSDVVVYFTQSSLRGAREKWNWLAPAPGGSAMAYAWDEPTLAHRLQVQAQVRNRMSQHPYTASYDVDKLGAKAPLNLPSSTKTFASNLSVERLRADAAQRDDSRVPDAVKERVASVLASEFSKKVYVTVFADGPTRVLRFSDEPHASEGVQQSVLDLAARLMQVEAELDAVDSRFLQLHGPSGGGELDLYGRTAVSQPAGGGPPQPARGSMRESRAASNTGRIRLRQRAVSGGEGSPLALARPESSHAAEQAEIVPDDARSLHSHHRSQGQDLSGSGRRAHVSKHPSERPVPSVLEPQELSRHLAQLHVPTSSQAVQGSDLMRSAAAADSALLLGGDLLVTVWQADGLRGGEKTTHPFARLRIGEQWQLTSVQWQSLVPRWEESLSFRDVSAASELLVELWDVGGSRGMRQLERLSEDPAKVIASSRFLGAVEVPLATTLAMSRGKKHSFQLTRRTAADDVSGSLRLSFAWNVTARSLLNLKLAALERVLAQRTEVICMLNPVPAETALAWARADAAPRVPPPDKAEEVERSEPSTTRSEERSLAERVLAKHLHEEHHSTLTVSVIEARGLSPRSGVVVAFQATQLPNPVVEVSVPGHEPHRVRARHTVNPRWETAAPARYKRLSSDARVTVRLFDDKGQRSQVLLGENTVSCSRLAGDKPMYVWLPLLPARRARSLGEWALRRGRDAPTMEQEETPTLQVHVRLQWVRQVVRGQYMNAEVSLAGLGLIVMGGLQDELFNLTVDHIKVAAELTHLEARLSGSVKRLQLDNQMLDATQPVVLAPASVAHAHSKTAQALTGGDGGLIEFGVVRSFAGSVLGDEGAERGLGQPVGTPLALREPEKAGEGSSTIMSFKEVWLTVGELDFQADDGFLEAILSFVVSIPMADVWQDESWREQQRKLLTAQFGPREVEQLSSNLVLPIDVDARDAVRPLEWIQAKEHRELQVLRDQSSYSSWYFIERAYISEINANVTIALTSSVLSGGRGEEAAAAAQRAGLFSRFIRASGFQLINVNNVPLSLGSWSLDTKLLGRKALVNALSRHYFAQGISEAHKVLGGAGPAIAAVPLTVVWVGGSFITLLTGISSGKVGPIGAAQRVGYVFFMSVAQVVSSLSRMGLSLMTLFPPNRTGVFSDSVTLAQAVQRPANAFEAFGRCWEELFDSLMAAGVGLLLDPTQGYHSGGLPLALMGLVKGTVGVAVRPAVGVLELVSKGTQGIGLVFLGREAITGTAQRRVRAPGALAEEQIEGDEAALPEGAGHQRNAVAAWQHALGHMFPSIKDDVVMEVINTHANRTLILCAAHVLLVRSSREGLALRSTLKSLWAVPISEIKIVRGDDDKLRINLEYSTKVDARCFGVWTIPRRKAVRCGSRDLMERIIVRINRHMSRLAAGPEEQFACLFDGADAGSLSIYRVPYTAAPQP